MKIKSDKNSEIIINKNLFFNKISLVDAPSINTYHETPKLKTKNDYLFLMENQSQIQLELKTIYEALEYKKSDENNKKHLLYCFYLAELMGSFYEDYNSKNGKEEFKEIKKEILKKLDEVAPFTNNKKQNDLRKRMTQLFEPFLHSSQLKKYIGQLNLWRIHLLFVKLTMNATIKNPESIEFITRFYKEVNVEQIKYVIEKTQDVFNALSVALFAVRLFIELATLIKHTWGYTQTEKDQTTCGQRLRHEVSKRHCNLGNDSFWSLVNGMGNYGIFGVSATLGNQITAVALVFDVLMFGWKLHLADQEYELAKAGIEEQRSSLHNELMTNLPFNQGEKKENMDISHQLKMLSAQSAKLEIDWNTKKQTFVFNIAAASLLVLGFTASLLLSPLGGYLVCTLAVAMYRSAESFSKYREKSLSQSALHQTKDASTEKEKHIAKLEDNLACKDFGLTLTKNFFVPVLLVTSFAICPPATAVLAIVCIALQVIYSRNKEHEEKLIEKEKENCSNPPVLSA